jgi:hypothetical protein
MQVWQGVIQHHKCLEVCSLHPRLEPACARLRHVIVCGMLILVHARSGGSGAKQHAPACVQGVVRAVGLDQNKRGQIVASRRALLGKTRGNNLQARVNQLRVLPEPTRPAPLDAVSEKVLELQAASALAAAPTTLLLPRRAYLADALPDIARA